MTMTMMPTREPSCLCAGFVGQMHLLAILCRSYDYVSTGGHYSIWDVLLAARPIDVMATARRPFSGPACS